jgi:regulation of enolase protein 1 (concanavalin A-like superfamily)
MKRTFLLIVLSLILLVPASLRAQRVFHHPGGVLSQQDFDRIKAHVDAGDEPWATQWKAFQNVSGGLAKSTYTASPNTEVGGSDGNRQRASRDATAAFYNAIEWHVTGQKAYADCAARILTAWGNKIETASAQLFQYPTHAFVTAAEMLRDSTGAFYSGWAEADRTTFLNKVRTVMVPACKSFCSGGHPHPSWFTPAAATIIGAGILLDDASIYNEGVKLMTNGSNWDPLFGGTIEEDGQVREMGRDNVHGGLSFLDITMACLVCWNQGDDLFAAGDNRLLKGMNYWCRYNTGHTDTPFKPLPTYEGNDPYTLYFISEHNNAFRLRPDAACFEAVYHHYKEVKGIDIENEYPYLGYAVKLARPENNANALGYGTLFFTIDPSTSAYMTTKPARLMNLKAEAGINCIYLSWDHPAKEDARGFKVYRSTYPIVNTSGTPYYTWDYYTNNRFKDTNVEPGVTYYYKVKAFNYAGDAASASTTAHAVASAGGELADGWTNASLTNTISTALYDASVQDTTIVVNAAGKDIGGRSDDQGFVYQKVSGDATITARIASTDENFFKQGLMIRGGLDPTSMRVALTKGELGYRLLRMGVRRGNNSNTIWINGSNYIYAPVWLRMTREGNKVTSYVSKTGADSTWIEVGTYNVSLPTDIYVGVGGCSGNDATAVTMVFDHVSVVNNAVANGISSATISRPQVSSEVAFFDLSGRRLPDAPEHGVYIVKSANGVRKYVK